MKNHRHQAHAELEHALCALTDGAGDERVWGPGPVGEKLFWINIRASEAFDVAAQLAHRMGARTPAEYLAVMPKLAPVILDGMFDLLALRGLE